MYHVVTHDLFSAADDGFLHDVIIGTENGTCQKTINAAGILMWMMTFILRAMVKLI